MLPKSGILDNLDKDVYLLSVIGEENSSDNVTPRAIAEYISELNGNPIMKETYKKAIEKGNGKGKRDGESDDKSTSRDKSIWERMKEDYPAFDKYPNIEYNDIKGKRFLLIDDNSTTGRTFKGLENFIRDNGGEIAGYYAMTVGQDASEKYIVTPGTWKDLEREGIENIRTFAEKEGIKREISKTGLSEHEAEILLKRYKNADAGRRSSSLSENGRIRKEIPSLYEGNGSKESTTEQIKSDTQASGFFDDKNNPDIRYAASDGKVQTANAAARDIIKTYNATGRVYVSDIQNSIKDLATKVQDVFYGEGDVEKALKI